MSLDFAGGGIARLIVALTLLIATARAEPPPGADPNGPVGQFYRSLKQPESGVSCCSISDCRPVDNRAGAKGYEAWVEDRWIEIPADKVIRGTANPLGRAVLCRSPGGVIYCFLPGSAV